MCINQFKPLRSKLFCRHRCITTPSIRPVTYDNISIKCSIRCIIIKVNAIVKCHRRHSAIFNQLIHLIYILYITVVFSGLLQVTKSHASTRIYIIRILISTNIKIPTFFISKISDVFLNQCLCKSNCCIIRYINCSYRVIIRTYFSCQRIGCTKDCIHMSRAVDTRDYSQPITLCIRNDGIHLRLRQFIFIKIMIFLIAFMNSTGYLFAIVSCSIHC